MKHSFCLVAVLFVQVSIAAKEDIDYTGLARSLKRSSENPVLKIGKMGMWNDQTLGCLTVLDDGDRFFLYCGGAQFGKPKNIGLAISRDGAQWDYFRQNPLFSGAMPYAIKVGDAFRLYHLASGNLQMSHSTDGFKWGNPRKIMRGCLDPCVVRTGEKKFHLYYCRGRKVTREKIVGWEFKNYVATSTDGINWIKHQDSVLSLGEKGSWDAVSQAGPCVLKLPDGFHMWYLGSGRINGKTAWRIGHATSPDGLRWTKSAPEPVLDVGPPGAWDQGSFMSFDILFRDRKLLFWYAAAPTGHGDETKMKIQIGHGTSK